ncbi:MAG TPA: HAD-IA family hydrolase [Arthrobacter sp.]
MSWTRWTRSSSRTAWPPAGAAPRCGGRWARPGCGTAAEGRIFSASEVANGKPALDLFLHAAGTLGAEPERCAVVDDSAHGVQAALRRRRHPAQPGLDVGHSPPLRPAPGVSGGRFGGARRSCRKGGEFPSSHSWPGSAQDGDGNRDVVRGEGKHRQGVEQLVETEM